MGVLIPAGLPTRVCCLSGLLCVVVEMRARTPTGQAAVPPGPAPALSSGPIAAMVPLHTVRGLSTVSRLPANERGA